MQNKYPHLAKKTLQKTEDSAAGEGSAVVNEQDQPTSVNGEQKPSQNPQVAQPSVGDSKIVKLTPEQLTIQTPSNIYMFSQSDSAFKTVKLVKFSKEKDPASGQVDLIDQKMMFYGSLQSEKTSSADLVSKFSGVKNQNSIEFSREVSGWKISQAFQAGDKDYLGLFKFSYTNNSSTPQPLKASVVFEDYIKPVKQAGGFFPSAATGLEGWQFLHYKLDGDFEDETLTSYCDGDALSESFMNAKLQFVGLNNRYFLKAVMPNDDKSTVSFKTQKLESGCKITYKFDFDAGMVAAGGSLDVSYQSFMGPKSASYLQSAQVDLRDNIQFGIFSFIAHPVLSVLKWIHSLVNNWGIAIIILTMMLKALFFPLTKAAAVSAIQMKKIQPEMKKMQEKYKDDRQKMQMEMMGLYKRHGVNPAKSCLPVLPQIPVFIAFYNVLMYSLELRHAPFMGWLQDLSNYDPYYILPILLGLLMVLQMKLTPNAAMDKTQQRVMTVMPLMFTFFMISLPSGLVVYMVINSILSITQQQWLNRRYADKPVPAAG